MLGKEKISKFQITVKAENEELKGTLTIVPNNKSICVNLKERIPYEMRLPILKEIFYQFCMPEARFFDSQIYLDGVENYKFIDNQFISKKSMTIFEELMCYDIAYFSHKKRKERILAYVKEGINIIDEKCSYYDDLYLPYFKRMGNTQKYKCYLLIQDYLDKKYSAWKAGRHKRDILTTRMHLVKKG